MLAVRSCVCASVRAFTFTISEMLPQFNTTLHLVLAAARFGTTYGSLSQRSSMRIVICTVFNVTVAIRYASEHAYFMHMLSSGVWPSGQSNCLLHGSADFIYSYVFFSFIYKVACGFHINIYPGDVKERVFFLSKCQHQKTPIKS